MRKMFIALLMSLMMVLPNVCLAHPEYLPTPDGLCDLIGDYGLDDYMELESDDWGEDGSWAYYTVEGDYGTWEVIMSERDEFMYGYTPRSYSSEDGCTYYYVNAQ